MNIFIENVKFSNLVMTADLEFHNDSADDLTVVDCMNELIFACQEAAKKHGYMLSQNEALESIHNNGERLNKGYIVANVGVVNEYVVLSHGLGQYVKDLKEQRNGKPDVVGCDEKKDACVYTFEEAEEIVNWLGGDRHASVEAL